MDKKYMKNYGFSLELEKLHSSETDWVFGALSDPCITDIKEEEREKYLPIGETQFSAYGDFTDCATRGPINLMETKFTWLLQNKKLLPKNEQWLRENGYIVNERVTFSDRFIAVLSGTTHQGNSLKAPLDAIRKNGLIPKSKLPKGEDMTWEQYYDKDEITGSLLALGQQFLQRFKINYEKVYEIHYRELIKEDMLDVAGYAWPTPVNGVYPKTDQDPNHCFMVVKSPLYEIFDNYIDPVDGDFIKQLAPDYDLLDYGYRLYITAQYIPSNRNWLADIIANLWQAFFPLKDTLKTPDIIIEPKPMDIPTSLPKNDLELLCEAIRDFEGKPGDRNYINKNPGNCRYSSVGYLPKYGIVKKDKDGFAIFETYDLGWLYLNNLVLDKIKKNPSWSLVTFFKNYAPASDGNNPTAYATFVGERMGVNPFTFRLGDMVII